MKMNGAVIVALAVAIGSFLQGWVFTLLIVGYTPTMKEQFKKMEFKFAETAAQWLVTNMVTMGVLLAQRLGKAGTLRFRSLPVIWSILRLFCSTVMFLSSGFYPIDGIGLGLSLIHIPAYYKETGRPCALHNLLSISAPICGIALCLKVCRLAPETFPGWTFALGVSFILSLMYSVLVIFYLPETPLWLAMNGCNVEARQVVQFLHGSEDVSDEMEWVLQKVGAGAHKSVVENNNDKQPAGEQKHVHSASSGCVNSGPVGDPFLVVSGDGSVREETLSTEEEDCTSNAEEASKLTISHRDADACQAMTQ